MNDAMTGQVVRAAAERYQQDFVPALFDQWPPRLLQLAGVGAGDTVLDVGCGTGVLARAAQDKVGSTGHVIGLDVNEGMLAVASGFDTRVQWLRAPAEQLPLENDSVDHVLSQFALMFFTEPDGAVAEMARVVRPGGRVVVATWAAVDTSPGYTAMVDLLRRVAGDGPAEALLAPFRIGTETALHEILAVAFDEITVHQWSGVARFPSSKAWLETEIEAWTLRDLISDDQYRDLQAEAPTVLSRFCGPDGQVSFPVTAIVADALSPR